MQCTTEDREEEDLKIIEFLDEISPHPPGCLSLNSFHSLVLDAIEALRSPPLTSTVRFFLKIEAIVATLHDIAPRSKLEARLAVQMLASHEMAIECTRRSMLGKQSFEGRDSNLKHADKLMALYERQLAALDKHRGKGRQKITVEHVTVEAGGQAIVGEVHTDSKSQPAKSKGQTALPDDSTGEELSREQLKPARTKAAKGRK